MTASVGDWYDNVSGRRNGGIGHDAENDDPVDRTPGSTIFTRHRYRSVVTRHVLARRTLAVTDRVGAARIGCPTGVDTCAWSLWAAWRGMSRAYWVPGDRRHGRGVSGASGSMDMP